MSRYTGPSPVQPQWRTVLGNQLSDKNHFQGLSLPAMFPRAQTACSLMCSSGEARRPMKAGTAPLSTTWGRQGTLLITQRGGQNSSLDYTQKSWCSGSYLLSVPRCPRGHVGEGPRRLELQCGFVIQRQKVHEAGQQTGVNDLLQRRVPLLWKQLPVGGEQKNFWSFGSCPPPPSLRYTSCVSKKWADHHHEKWSPTVLIL